MRASKYSVRTVAPRIPIPSGPAPVPTATRENGGQPSIMSAVEPGCSPLPAGLAAAGSTAVYEPESRLSVELEYGRPSRSRADSSTDEGSGRPISGDCATAMPPRPGHNAAARAGAASEIVFITARLRCGSPSGAGSKAERPDGKHFKLCSD